MSVTPRRPLAVQPHPYIGDVVGRPLDRGMIYFGEPDKDPQDYPITVYLDPEQTKPAHQPIRTKGGFINVFGDITEIFADEILYSLKVLDCYGRLVFYKKRMHRDNITEELGGEIVRAQKAESALQSSIDAEAVRAKAAESDLNANIIKEVSDRESEVVRLDEADAVLQAQINSVGGGKLAYKTYAEMIADKSNIAAKSSIDILADTDDKNGTYLYDGTDFVKSQYDIEKVIRAKVQNTFGAYTQMAASNLSEGAYALVADDIDDKNGIYIKENGSWVKSKYDPVSLAIDYADSTRTDLKNIINSLVEADSSSSITHGFVDKNNTLIASFDKNGEFDFYPTEATKRRVNSLQENDDDDYVFLITDNDGRILSGIDKDGNQVTKDLNSSGGEMPLKTPFSSVNDNLRVKSINLVAEKLALNTIGKGRSTDPDIEIKGDGLTHPKMIYIPQGWNGYMYWLTATPTFGVIGGQAAYENPHVWASNDLVNWVEPSGGRIDEPEDNSSWWSDSHLALDDDGWLYCIYRGNYFTFANHCVVAKRSRDGVNWSERIMIFNSNNEPVDGGVLSPAIYKSGSYWNYVDINNSTTALEIEVDYGSRGVFRRTSDKVVGKYTPYSIDTLLRYPNKTWGEDQSPWHIDALKVGNIHLQLIAMGTYTSSMSSELYIAYSTDGWNFKSLPKLDIIKDNAYRSSLTLKKVEGSEIHFDMLVARAGTGIIDLFNLVLEVV